MKADELRTVHKATPFRPFTLVMADGERLAVVHPELLFITPGGRTTILATSDDAFKILDVPLITSIDVGNGKPRRSQRKRGG